MLKINGKQTKEKKSQLNVTPGEMVRNSIIQAAQEGAYAAGNNTDKIVKLAEDSGTLIDRTTELVGGGESATSLGKIMFKTTKDIARADKVCTGLCIVSATSESIALCCSTIKVIPFRGRIYVAAKIVSRGCMSFRNACAGEGC